MKGITAEMKEQDYSRLLSEGINPDTVDIDKASALGIVRMINNEDKKVADAVEKELADIAAAAELIAQAIRNGGRLFYCGAGTSGRLGVLDASECPPTYGVSQDVVIGLVAGGYRALYDPVEAAEDDTDSIASQMKEHRFCEKDVLTAISASGSAPCVMGAVEYAAQIGAKTISVSCNRNSVLAGLVDISIAVEVGPEVISGSTRMKAGTAQKMVLNMLTTCAMILLGKVRGNLMSHMRASNIKLADRAVRIAMAGTSLSREEARDALEKADYRIYEVIDKNNK